jgi:hypothetical protein
MGCYPLERPARLVVDPRLALGKRTMVQTEGPIS